jgi:SAM-dependent methyltransferase
MAEAMRFSNFFSKQAQKPSGWFGRLVMSRIFDIGNARLNRLVYQILMPQPGDHILDLGCGTGKLIHNIACRGGNHTHEHRVRAGRGDAIHRERLIRLQLRRSNQA